jgi:hypothetical protein
MEIKYGLLKPIAFSHSNPKRSSDKFWLFECDCGNTKISRLYDVKRGKINSCGCIHKKQLAERNKSSAKHGYFGTSTYNSWSGIIERCCNPNSGNYNMYGAKGITMCERWRESFEAFLEDMGERPQDCSIDRIDVYGNYEPNNCRWANAKTQARNRSNNVRYEYDGKNLTLAEWSEITGVRSDTMHTRIKKLGWSLEDALTRKPIK